MITVWGTWEGQNTAQRVHHWKKVENHCSLKLQRETDRQFSRLWFTERSRTTTRSRTIDKVTRTSLIFFVPQRQHPRTHEPDAHPDRQALHLPGGPYPRVAPRATLRHQRAAPPRNRAAPGGKWTAEEELLNHQSSSTLLWRPCVSSP